MDKKSAIGILFVMVITGLLALVSSGFQKTAMRPDRLQVTASFYPLAFFSERIGGEKAEVLNMTPAGAEPHDYEPTARDIVRMGNSRLVVLIGGGLEAWEDSARQDLDRENTVVVTAGEGLMGLQIEEEGEAIADPHIWLSPPLAERIADKIAQGFMEIDPANGEYYRSNADALKTELAGLDGEFKRGLSDCSEKNIITSHDAFGYLAAAYGFDQMPISGLSPDEEPSPRQLAGIAEFAKANDVEYIFFESLASPKLSETIADEVGAETLALNPLEGLSDEEIMEGKNYFTEMRDNLANLKIALQCR